MKNKPQGLNWPECNEGSSSISPAPFLITVAERRTRGKTTGKATAFRNIRKFSCLLHRRSWNQPSSIPRPQGTNRRSLRCQVQCRRNWSLKPYYWIHWAA